MRVPARVAIALAILALLGACAGPGKNGSELIGMTGPALHEVLGDPQRIRREAGAQIWQYASPACVLDVFLYEEARGSAVVHVEARNLDGGQADTSRCMGSLDRGVTTS